MDTEKHLELEKKIRLGESPSDEGPYYHHSWWESYKGGVKGKLGGLVIGGTVGLIAGLIAGGVLAFATPLLATTAVPLAAIAFVGAGAMYGAHEFSEIGKSVGNTAAQFQLYESREKIREKGQMAEIKEQLGEIKSIIKGETPNPSPKNLAAIQEASDLDKNYRKTHYAKLNPPKINTFAFWKVALIGLAVGAALGALLAVGGPGSIIYPVLLHTLGETTAAGLSAGGIMALSSTVFGALGASFGISRDFFRKVFDTTDLLFKGVINPASHAKVREHQVEAGLDVQEKLAKKPEITTTVLPEYGEGGVVYPKSETHFRDKTLPAAQRALLSFDHTRATPQ